MTTCCWHTTVNFRNRASRNSYLIVLYKVIENLFKPTLSINLLLGNQTDVQAVASRLVVLKRSGKYHDGEGDDSRLF